MLNEAGFKMPTKISKPSNVDNVQDTSQTGDANDNISKEVPSSETGVEAKAKAKVTLQSIRKMNIDAIRQDQDKWLLIKKDVCEMIKSHPYFNKIFGDNKAIDYREEAYKGNLTVYIADNGEIEIHDSLFLCGDKNCKRWDKLFNDVFAKFDLFDLGTIFGNFTIGMCSTMTTLPEVMPKYVHGNMNILNIPNLNTLGDNLPKANTINIESCPNIPAKEIEAIGAVTESLNPRSSQISEAVASRIELAKRYRSLNESTINEDFRSTKLSKLFNTTTGSKNDKTHQLTDISAENRDILMKIDKSTAPIMWSEITDDMVTVQHPEFGKRTKTILNRRDQEGTDDWGLRIVCDEDGKIVFVTTGNNKSKKNPNPDTRYGEYDSRLYDWENDQGILYMDADLATLINERVDYVKAARKAFGIYVNAVFDLKITAPDVKAPWNDAILTSVSSLQDKVNNSEFATEHKISWQSFKNQNLYDNLAEGPLYDKIITYYTDAIEADDKSIDAVDEILKSGQKAIDEFSKLNVDYTKASLSRIHKLTISRDNSPIGYSVYDMVMAVTELVPDKLVTFYDIDSKIGVVKREAGDDRAPLGDINPYDKEIADTGYFDVEKNRETDDVERSKFGFLNNTRKRRIIQDARRNSITGSVIPDKSLNDPRMKDIEARGDIFTSNTDNTSRDIFTIMKDMTSSVNVRAENTKKMYDRVMSKHEDTKDPDKKKTVYDLKYVYSAVNYNVLRFSDDCNYFVRIVKLLDSTARELAIRSDDPTKLSTGYKDSASGMLADAYERMQDKFNDTIFNYSQMQYTSAKIYNIINFDVEDYLKRDESNIEDLRNKLSSVIRRRKFDDTKTNNSMKYYEDNFQKMREESLKKLKTCLERIVSAYAYLISRMSDLRNGLKALDS